MQEYLFPSIIIYIMNSIKIYITSLYILLSSICAHTQECQFPNQRCLCSSGTPLCKCDYITDQATLNFSSNYSSHLTLVPGFGCQPCPPSCLECISEQVCTICRQEFYLKQGVCYPCPINCKQCSQNFCSQCLNRYYLDSRFECQLCPWAGTLECTINQLKLCETNFYMDNNGAQCIRCDFNCRECSSTTKCRVCKEGYYLDSNYKCSQCNSQCKNCLNFANNCIDCFLSSQYFHNEECIDCPEGCASCSQNQCFQCQTGYAKQYKKCLLFDSPILACQDHYFNQQSEIRCQKCQKGYFLDSNSSRCHFGCSILCQQCQGAHYGLCLSCNPAVQSTYMNLNCLPNYNINDGTAYQLYYTIRNNPSTFKNIKLKSRTQLDCLYQSIGIGDPNIMITLENLQAYKLSIQLKLYSIFQSSDLVAKDPTYLIKFMDKDNNIETIITNQEIDYQMECQCVICITKLAFKVQGIVSVTNQLFITSIQVNSQYPKIAISEILVVSSRCGGLKGVTCASCSSINQCTKCINPQYYILNQLCVAECPSNYFTYEEEQKCYGLCPYGTYAVESLRKCMKCQPQCTGCSSLENCFACSDGYFLYQQLSKCVSICPQRYFPNQYRKKCERCIFPCLQCLSNRQCKSCLYGFLDADTYSCVTNCPQQYYASLQTNRCQNCLHPCQTCQESSSFCLTCVSNYTYFNNNCYEICPSGYYIPEDLGQCHICPHQCRQCRSQNECLSCRIGYLHNSRCLSRCPIGYFENEIMLQCLSCPQNCTICESQSQCSACQTGFLFYQAQQSCVEQCPDQYYFNDIECKACEVPCITCLSLNYCLSCSELFLFDGSCYYFDECPSSTYPQVITLTCVSCPQLCLKCSNYDECQQCLDGYSLFDGECFDECPVGTFEKIGICQLCSIECKQCINQEICTQCETGFIISNGKCANVCPIYTFTNYETQRCEACPDQCIYCQNAQVCQRCETNYYLSYRNEQVLCVSQCQKGYFSLMGQCQQCRVPCSECLSEIQCLTCSKGYGYLYQGSCISSCPQGSFIREDNETSICQACDFHCLTCLSEDQCIVCKQNFFLDINLRCVSAHGCGIGYYGNTLQNLCLSCSEFCLQCSYTGSNCTQCKEGYLFHENTCLESCPQTFFSQKNSMVCQSCSQNCRICFSQQHCNTCLGNYNLLYLNNNTVCVENCPSTTYFQQRKQCIPCIYPCKQCYSRTQCLSCLSGFYLQGQCLSKCPYGFKFSADNSECVSCGVKCAECDQVKCLLCQNSVLIQGSCYDQCPLGTYEAYGVCFNCMHGCSDCNNSFTCNKCIQGFLFEGQCRQYCPINLVAQNNTCITCKSGCKSCEISAQICTKCYDGNWLYLGQCISNCPTGTYSSTQFSSCLSCNLPCQTCSNAYSCQSCIYGYILYIEDQKKQCVQGPYCPNSYFLSLSQNYCKIECNNKEYTELISRTCSEICPIGFVTYENNLTCLQKCPSEMWINSEKKCTHLPSPNELPYYTCKSLTLRNTLFISCKFSVPIVNLESLTINNIKVDGMKVSSLEIRGNNSFRFVTTPLFNTRIDQLWLKVQITPAYQLYSDSNSVKLSNNGSFNIQNQSYPVQNTEYSMFISFFHQYSFPQRETGLYLMQVANSLSLVALIFWVFSLIKNRKVISLIAVTGMQWICSLVLLQSHLPPNIKQFLEGFQYSRLIFELNFEEQKLEIPQFSIWQIQTINKPQITQILNLDDLFATGLPIISIVVAFGLIYGLLRLLLRIIDPKQLEEEHWSNDVRKKLEIIKKRYKFNYLHHITYLCVFPITTLFLVQINSPSLLGIIIGIILFACLFGIIGHSIYLSCLTSHSDIRFFVLTSIENMILSAISLYSDISLYTGLTTAIFILNIVLWPYIFNRDTSAWKPWFLVLTEILRQLIIVSICICQFTVKQSEIEQVYNRGWATVILIFSYCFTIQVISARDFFEDQSKGKKQVENNEENKEEKLLENQKNNDEDQSQMDVYQSESESFFEDEEQIIDSDEQSFSELSQNSQRYSAPQKLIKYDK